MSRALLLATALMLMAAPVDARDCADTFKAGPSYRGAMLMPPPKYWVPPGTDFHVLTCTQIRQTVAPGSNADCHLMGGFVPHGFDLMTLGMWSVEYDISLIEGDIYICRGLTGVRKTMTLIHEYAHRAGWLAWLPRGSNENAISYADGSRLYTVKEWLADPAVPDWAKQ